jgi:predicted aspartyl protease
MSSPFNPSQGLIIVNAELYGPLGSVVLRLAVNTGATGTVINTGMLVSIGYDPSLSPNRIQVTTGSGVEFAPIIKISKISALKNERTDFPVLGHTLPPSAGVDGLLGLDFFRGQLLVIDFSIGEIALS